jgi:hypothetical protein
VKSTKTKDEYIQRLASELKEWNEQIDRLAAKSSHAVGYAKLKYVEELGSLQIKQHAAADKMKELEEASGDAWATVKATADKVWDDLKSGVASAVGTFK